MGSRSFPYPHNGNVTVSTTKSYSYANQHTSKNLYHFTPGIGQSPYVNTVGVDWNNNAAGFGATNAPAISISKLHQPDEVSGSYPGRVNLLTPGVHLPSNGWGGARNPSVTIKLQKSVQIQQPGLAGLLNGGYTTTIVQSSSIQRVSSSSITVSSPWVLLSRISNRGMTPQGKFWLDVHYKSLIPEAQRNSLNATNFDRQHECINQFTRVISYER
jgi:hypothetical protein